MYDDFAKIYDRFQKTDYNKFTEFYESVFDRLDVTPKTVVDLGCGSGAVTIPLARAGYEVTGIDISPDMLAVAQNKADEAGLDILFLNMDMRTFALPAPVDCVISALDCVNYLEGLEDAGAAFERVYDSLRDGGVFIFDINSEYKLSSILGNNTFVYEDDSAFCVWKCGYFPDDKVVSFELNFFIKEQNSGYTRYSEYQEETIFSAGELKELLFECGFSEVSVFADLTFDGPGPKTERLFFVARK